MAKKRILILGAGLAGLSAAWHLKRLGLDCQVFEKESDVGGLCRSKNINGHSSSLQSGIGFIFDYSGHLLHFRRRYTFNLIKNLLGRNLIRHKRNAWIYAYGIYSRYPFQANLYGIPPRIIKECLLGFIEASRKGKSIDRKRSTFLDWINETFGQGIARHFMIPYNTKFWTLPPSELTCEWLDGFIPVPSLDQVIEGTIKESDRQFGYNAWFWYPKKGGISQLPLALSAELENIHTGSTVTEIEPYAKTIKTDSGARERYDYLIYTLPLPEVGNLTRGADSEITSFCKRLKWNSIINLNLGIEKRDMIKKHWVYFPQKETSFFRVGFVHNFSANITPDGKSSLYAEVSYSEHKPINKKDIVQRIQKDLYDTGILSKDDRICLQDLNDIKYAYPIYDRNHREVTTQIFKYLYSNNIVPCGRYGSWRYLSMEDVILDGKRIAEFLSRHV
jgi:protoporphyrinogen oxidase